MEMIIKKNSDFYFSSYDHFSVIFLKKMSIFDDNSENKNRIFFYSHSRSIQNIAHHIQSKKDGVISEGGGVRMSFFVTQPKVNKDNSSMIVFHIIEHKTFNSILYINIVREYRMPIKFLLLLQKSGIYFIMVSKRNFYFLVGNTIEFFRIRYNGSGNNGFDLKY